jgi:hypothetical protein
MSLHDDGSARHQDADQDAKLLSLMTDEGLALLEKLLRAHGNMLDVPTRGAIRSAINRLASKNGAGPSAATPKSASGVRRRSRAGC